MLKQCKKIVRFSSFYHGWLNKENRCICKIHKSKDHFVEQKIIRIKCEILICRTQYYLLIPIEPIERLATHYLFDFWTYFGLDEIRSLVTDKQNNQYFIAKKKTIISKNIISINKINCNESWKFWFQNGWKVTHLINIYQFLITITASANSSDAVFTNDCCK